MPSVAGPDPWGKGGDVLYPGLSAGFVHLCGSVPAVSNDEVFRRVSRGLPGRIKRIPDGENGPRLGWVMSQLPVLQSHPHLEDAPPDERFPQIPRVRARAGIDPGTIKFGSLGYADAAIGSYKIFAGLRRIGVINQNIRFLVSLPTPLAVSMTFAAAGQRGLEKAYEVAMRTEVRRISEAIPPMDLAIQWDTPVEVGVLEGIWSPTWTGTAEEEITTRLVRLGGFLREPIEVGYHFCYGDQGRRHFKEPQDLRTVVELANSIARNTRRSVNWIHMPVPRARDDEDYYTPLRDLTRREETELYLGLIHDRDLTGARRRIKCALDFVEDFGIATECGWGRRAPSQIDGLIRQHFDAATEMRNNSATETSDH